LASACGGGGGSGAVPDPGRPPEPTSAEQTLTDLFNLTALYQRMGRLAGGNPLPFVGSTAFYAGRNDSTIVLLGLSLENRTFSFQRKGRDFVARYRVEVGIQRQGALPLRYAREEAVTVTSYQETQRADESVVFQQGFLLAPGTYQLSVVVRDPGGNTFSRAEAALTVPTFPAGSFTTPAIVYRATPRADLWTEPNLLLNPRGTVAHGGDSLVVMIETYGLPGPTELPFSMRDEQDRVLVERNIQFQGGKAVETATVLLPAETPSLGRLTITAGPPGAQKQTSALVSFSRSWVLTNYDNLLNLLRFLGQDEWIERLRKSPPEDRAGLWRRFWVETDPIPATPENEALDTYFTRVAIANERYRDEGIGQGWRSERGEVFIVLGPPDQEYESPPGNDTRIVQWLYNEYRAVIVFTGTVGFSRLRLTPSSRSEFNRVKALVRQREMSTPP
jgi:GWxTD domain-containing protein